MSFRAVSIVSKPPGKPWTFRRRSSRSTYVDINRFNASIDEVCVCDFTSALPLNQPTVSHHLKILRDAGLVTWERRGTWVYYRLAGDARARLDAVLDSLLPEKALA
jgi:DNA-binding transcriptional ArsR family regulator